MFTWIKYPFILGDDLAGEIVEVGKGVTRFRVGDRVIAHAVGMSPQAAKATESAFQLYTVIRTNLASAIPPSMTYETACVLPLAVSTAACGMFQKDYLALPYPTVPAKPNGKTLLIWAGSTSVGCSAIQLAVASGHEVITTCSPKNFDLVKRLGAAKAFDYRSPTVIKDIIREFKHRESAGALAISKGSLQACIEIIGASKGKKFVAQASVDLPTELPSSIFGWAKLAGGMGWFTVSTAAKSRLQGVSYKFIFGSDLMKNEVGGVIYKDFLPTALAQGTFVPAPEPLVVGKGLAFVQEALDVQKKGVSARKVVVSL